MNTGDSIRSLTSAAMIALVSVSCTSSTVNDSQEKQWQELKLSVCQLLDSKDISKAESVLEAESKKASGKELLKDECLSALGKVYRYSGEPNKAEAPFQTLVKDNESIGGRRCLALPENLIALSDCYVDQKKYEPAVDLLMRAAVMQQTMSPAEKLIPTLRKLARAFESVNNKNQAQVFYQLAIDADASQQSIPEKDRSDILLFDQANLMWDYSSFLARQNQKAQSDALEARADHLFKILIDRAEEAKSGKEQLVLGFKAGSDAAKAASLIDVLVSKGKVTEAEELLGRYYDISVDLAGFAGDENDFHAQFIKALDKIWYATPARKIETAEDADRPKIVLEPSDQKKLKSLGYAADVAYQAGRFADAQLKASTVLLSNYNSPEAVRVLSLIAAKNGRLQEVHELGLRLQSFAE